VSLLPDCLAAKLPGSLAEVEQVLAAVESASTVESAADDLRPDVELPARLRWVGRRRTLVYAGLVTLRTLMPDELIDCSPTIGSFRDVLDEVPVLPLLRAVGAEHLHVLPPPLGFGPRRTVTLRNMSQAQQRAGARAPPSRP